MKISDDYAKQLQFMHSGTITKIGFGIEPPEKLVEMIKTLPINTVLDFGCGEGNMMKRLSELFPNLQMQGYDPGLPQFSLFPLAVDLIYSVDVLEHVESHLIDDTLVNLWNAGKYQYHNIACHPAKKNLPDGRNCHLIVAEPEWWLEKIKSTLDPSCKITYTNVYHTFKKRKKGTHLEVVIEQ